MTGVTNWACVRGGMIDLLELAARIEAADAPDRALFQRAGEAVYGQSHAGWPQNLHYAYEGCLAAEAWTSAAEMLVPEGWHTCFMHTGRHSGSCRWELRQRAGDSEESRAVTPGQALAAAAIRAHYAARAS